MRVWIGMSMTKWNRKAKPNAATTPATHSAHCAPTGKANRAISTLATPNQAMRTTSFVMNMENDTWAAVSTHFDGRGVGMAPAARMISEMQTSDTKACLSKYWTKASISAAPTPTQPARRGAIQTFCANQARAMPSTNSGRARMKP